MQDYERDLKIERIEKHLEKIAANTRGPSLTASITAVFTVLIFLKLSDILIILTWIKEHWKL